MNKNTIKFFSKILLLSFIIVIIFNIWDNLLNASINTNTQTKIEENTTSNENLYKSQNNWQLWVTWVAISTNIWTSYTQINSLPATIYKEIFSISELIEDENSSNEIIWNNMNIIKEYLNILKTDIKWLIDSSYDKSALLNAYIEQLEFRYQNWIENQQLLTNQKQALVTSMNDSNTKIEILKAKIDSDFKNSNAQASLENIEEYLQLKQEYYYAKTYIIYINHFLEQYNFLNNYALNLAEILVNNKEAIIKNAYVVISENVWVEELKEFDLIFEE